MQTKNNSNINPNKKTFLEKKMDHNSVINYLVEKYPKCFFSQAKVLPLKIGLIDEIFEDQKLCELFSKTQIRKALQFYTSQIKYLKAQIYNPYRFNLQGEKVSNIPKDQIEYAKEKLQLMQQKRSEFLAKKTLQRLSEGMQVKIINSKQHYLGKVLKIQGETCLVLLDTGLSIKVHAKDITIQK